MCLISGGYLYRGSYLSAHVLLNSLNELRKRDKMRGQPSILSLFLQRVYNNTGAQMFDSINHMTLNLIKITFLALISRFCHLLRTIIMDVIMLRH